MEILSRVLQGGGCSTDQQMIGLQVALNPATIPSIHSAGGMPPEIKTAASALDLLVQVMKSLPAKEAPIFDCVKDGDCYQVNILLNVSGTRFTSDPVGSVAKVLGNVCSGQEEALLSAVEEAFLYLEKNHLIWSSKVAENYENKRVFSDLNECYYAIENIFAEWSLVIDTIEKFRSEMKVEMSETVHGIRSAVSEMYCEGNNFVGSVIKKIIENHRAMYLEWREYECQRSMHLKVCNDKITGYVRKGLSEVVHFNEKDVLDYVLEFISLKKAEYSNEVLFKSGLFRGEVIIHLPAVEEARCGGRTKFHGIDLFTAPESEEDAAGKALRYLESKLKLRIVDKNYADRVEAERNHEFRTRLLVNFLDVAEKIKKQWAYMIEDMKSGVDLFAGDVCSSKGAQLSAEQVAARKVIVDGIMRICDDCISRYEGASTKINGMDKYYPKVAKLNN